MTSDLGTGADAAASRAAKTSDVARVYGLVAREAPVAILLRRGPSRQVRLLRWDLRSDTIEPGQWFKGRIYERRCDLSPKGDRLVYFAAKHTGPYGSWTAISRPPDFTALALWPKGDCWGGGGLFADSDLLRLNHPVWPGKSPEESFRVASGFQVPAGLKVVPLGHCGLGGEDEPIHGTRLMRDGWEVDQPGEPRGYQRGGAFSFPYDEPAIRSRPIPRSSGLRLRVHLHGIGEKGARGRWYAETADIADRGGHALVDLGRIDWVDCDRRGDVLLSRDGRVARISGIAKGRLGPAREPKLVADLNDMAFEPVTPGGRAARR